MQITLKLFASFRNDRFKAAQKEIPDGTDCRTIVRELGLTEEEIGIILVNGRHVTLDYVLNDSETLSLFPLVGGG
ncbi:MAG: MoaD/ThiS family protein [Desulfuromonadaceae bacterium]|nr:MoaD/ThiS family protein [Desulfuromonadaceae bacterium]MDD2846913.1 MoaD/ThiS family protein [Desulfuromonadaceae bacterium]MDD4129109.1 MoaD/ThiS family protein [Desulfuromonadaceae bacterium]